MAEKVPWSNRSSASQQGVSFECVFVCAAEVEPTFLWVSASYCVGMSLFSENPAHFSKSRLKSDLVAHNVALPPAKSRKHVYVELHLKHIQRKNAAEFSSDEEDQVQNAEVSAVVSGVFAAGYFLIYIFLF